MADNNNRPVGTKQSPEYIKKLIVEEATRQGVPVELALAVAQHESGFNNLAVSKANTDGSKDYGVFQLNDRYHKLNNVYDPVENIRYGIGMLKAGLAKNNGNVQKTLSDYNAGANATGAGRRAGDAYALKVMTGMNKFTPSEINKIASSDASITGAAAPVSDMSDNLGDKMAELQQAGLEQGERIVDKYIKDSKYDTKLYKDIRSQKQKEIEQTLNDIRNLPTTASPEQVQDITNRFNQARQDMNQLQQTAIDAIQSGIGANQVDAYYNKLAQADEERLARMQAANPYTQLSQQAPLDLSDYERAVGATQNRNAMMRALNVNQGRDINYGTVDFGAEAMQRAQAAQAAQLAAQTGLTPEQFVQRGLMDYNTMGATFNNQQQVMANLVQAAYNGDRQAQAMLANMYQNQGAQAGNLATQELQAIRNADADALARAQFAAEQARWATTQGQNLDAYPIQADAAMQQQIPQLASQAVSQGAQRGTTAAGNLLNYQAMLEKAAAGQDGSPDVMKTVNDYWTRVGGVIGMNPSMRADDVNEYIKQMKASFALANPNAAPILYYPQQQATNYSQFNVTGQNTFNQKPQQ